jgi:hypothetical protein
MNECVEIILLCLHLELTQLGKSIMDHNNFCDFLGCGVRDEDLPILLDIAGIELIVYPDSC